MDKQAFEDQLFDAGIELNLSPRELIDSYYANTKIVEKDPDSFIDSGSYASSIVNDSFNWSESKQKNDYWRRVYHKLINFESEAKKYN